MTEWESSNVSVSFDFYDCLAVRDPKFFAEESSLLPDLVVAALALWPLHQAGKTEKVGVIQGRKYTRTFLTPSSPDQSEKQNLSSGDSPVAPLIFTLRVSTYSWRRITQPFMPLFLPHFRQPMFQLPVPILTKLLLWGDLSAHCWKLSVVIIQPILFLYSDQIGWSEEMTLNCPKLAQYLLFWFFYGTHSICIYHQVSKAQSRVSVYSGQDHLQPPGLPASVWPASYARGLPPQGICHRVICILCLFCWQIEQLLLAFCASKGARGICLDSVHLCIAADPQWPLISWTQVATLSEHTGISAYQFQSPS